jgi:hypothetical protein
LGTERANAEDVSHRIDVPPFGQHRHRDDAADLFAEPTDATDGVHHLAQQSALAGFPLRAGRPLASGKLALELFDLRAGSVAEPLVQCIAGFDLARVDQQCPRAGKAAFRFEVRSSKEKSLLLLAPFANKFARRIQGFG